MEAPMIIGKAHNWRALLRPRPSDIQPLNIQPTNAPPKHVLTTKPSDNNKRPIKQTFNKSQPINLLTKYRDLEHLQPWYYH